MKAAGIFATFFLIFTSALIAVPIRLFPGNMITTLFGVSHSEYITCLEALTNGLTYGFIVWIVFIFLARKIE